MSLPQVACPILKEEPRSNPLPFEIKRIIYHLVFLLPPRGFRLILEDHPTRLKLYSPLAVSKAIRVEVLDEIFRCKAIRL